MDERQQPLATEQPDERTFSAALSDFAVHLAAISDLNRWCDFVI